MKLHTGINYNAVLEHTVSRIEEMGRLFKERAEAQQGYEGRRVRRMILPVVVRGRSSRKVT